MVIGSLKKKYCINHFPLSYTLWYCLLKIYYLQMNHILPIGGQIIKKNSTKANATYHFDMFSYHRFYSCHQMSTVSQGFRAGDPQKPNLEKRIFEAQEEGIYKQTHYGKKPAK